MQIPQSVLRCPKCDAELLLQTDGSVLHVDIAHHHETVRLALLKLEHILAEAAAGLTSEVRVVTGRGLIREEVIRQLSWLQYSGEILGFETEGVNTGAIRVRIRR